MKQQIENPRRFWLGVALIVPEILYGAFLGISNIDWSFITLPGTKTILQISAAVLYNVIAGILIWNGSTEKEIPKKKK